MSVDTEGTLSFDHIFKVLTRTLTLFEQTTRNALNLSSYTAECTSTSTSSSSGGGQEGAPLRDSVRSLT